MLNNNTPRFIFQLSEEIHLMLKRQAQRMSHLGHSLVIRNADILCTELKSV